MRIKILLSLLCLSAAISASCNSHSNHTNNNAASNSNTPTATNHDHHNMNHGNMNHSEMKSSPDAANAPYDLQFIDTMIAHHQGAVDMAKPAESKAQHAELKALAKSIITDQENEISLMKKWREEWFSGKPAAMNMEMSGMNDSMKGMDMQKLLSLSGKDFDLEFIKQMIPHHEGAVIMAKEALQKSQKEEIKALAIAIIKAQEAEIKQMKEWQTAWSK